MCFNANISITTFLLGVVAIIIGYINKTITYSFGLFYFSVIFMQFIEFLIWVYLNNSKINNYLSIVGSLLLKIQPLLLLYVLYSYDKEIIVLLILLLILYYLISLILNNTNYRTIIGKNKSLQWDFLNMSQINLLFYYISALIILYFIYKKDNDKYFKFLLISFIVIFTISFIFTFTRHYYDNTFGSLFCFYINLFSLVIIITSIYKNYDLYLRNIK